MGGCHQEMTSLDLRETPATTILKVLNQQTARAFQLVNVLETRGERIEELEGQVLKHVRP
jgi:hypothetical protein